MFLPLRLETLPPSRILSNSISQNSPKPLKSLDKILGYKTLSFCFIPCQEVPQNVSILSQKQKLLHKVTESRAGLAWVKWGRPGDSPGRPGFARVEIMPPFVCLKTGNLARAEWGRPGDSPGRPGFARAKKIESSVPTSVRFSPGRNGVAWATQICPGEALFFWRI